MYNEEQEVEVTRYFLCPEENCDGEIDVVYIVGTGKDDCDFSPEKCPECDHVICADDFDYLKVSFADEHQSVYERHCDDAYEYSKDQDYE